MSDINTELVEGGYDAFGRGDMDVVMTLLQHTEWHEAAGGPQGGVYSGAEAILNGVFGPLMQQIPGFKVTPQEILSVGEDRVLAIGDYSGQGADGELKARFAHVWTIKEGTATHFEQFADTALLRRAAGQ